MRSLSTRTAGLLILALGLWGALVPFVGHYFHFALGPDKSWTWTQGRFYLSVLPGAVAAIGGLMLIASGPRSSARLGALLALAAGAWFAIGPEVSLLWNSAGAQGAAHGSKLVRVLEMLAYHTALGVLIVALAAYALPRFPKRAIAAEAGAAGAGAAGAGAGVAAERTMTRGGERSAGYGVGAAGERAADRRGAVADEPASRPGEPVAAEDAPTSVHEREEGRGATAREPGYDERATDPARGDYPDRSGARNQVGEDQAGANQVGDRQSGGSQAGGGQAGPSQVGNGQAGGLDNPGPALTHNGDRDSSEDAATTEAEDQQPTASPPAMRVRRRRGGLLSFLRR